MQRWAKQVVAQVVGSPAAVWESWIELPAPTSTPQPFPSLYGRVESELTDRSSVCLSVS